MTIDAQVGLELFTARTTNGTSTAQTWSAPTGKAMVGAEGTWDGATVTFKASRLASVATQTVPGVSLTSSTPFQAVDLFGGENVEAVISGAGASTSLTVWIMKVED